MIRLTAIQCCLLGLAQYFATLLTANAMSGLVATNKYYKLPTVLIDTVTAVSVTSLELTSTGVLLILHFSCQTSPVYYVYIQ